MERLIEVLLKKGIFLVSRGEDAQFLESKGYGQRSSLFTLSFQEALYLLEKKWIFVVKGKKELDFQTLLGKQKASFFSYLVYKDLRQRGYSVQSGLKFGADFRLYDKGHRDEEHALWLVLVLREDEQLKMKDFVAKNRIATTVRKRLLFALVSEDHSLSYFECNWRRM
ncbi:tRNA-intron lyase [Candidatus Woesearchaeota archaeon]|nr:tRNA-intron lyase [Nanoarchaeota archaeon]MCB9370275.1 tRNA-intron lyase [Candidatus Woesearchaeota archaeon]USN44799.1 MAG: tRNA-intron lyase [Candidatus Woesearchaeota archaeon]